MVEDELIINPSVSHRRACKFQRPCWKNVRAPIAKKNKIFLPYICSYQEEGDLEKCGIRDRFLEEEKESEQLNGV